MYNIFQRTLILIVSFLFAMSCSNGDNSTIIIHPTSENIEVNHSVFNSISFKDSTTSDIGIKTLKDRLKNYNVEFIIGKEQGESHYIFGDIVDSHYDADRNKLFLLDSQKVGISVFNNNGEYLYNITREGRGPGELTNPNDIIYRDNMLYILDWSFQINEYSIQDKKFEFSNQFITPFPPFGLCINNEYIYIQSLPATNEENDGTFHNIFQFELKDPSEPLNSFGKLYEANSWVARTTMSMGGIVCADDSDTIVQYFNLLNLMYGYEQDGSLKWVTSFEDFNYIQYSQIGNRMRVVKEPAYTYNDIYNAIPFSGDNFVVQIPVRKSNNPNTIPESIHSYIVNFNDGKAIYVGEFIPLLLSIDESTLIFQTDDPYPQIKIASY